MKTLRAAIFVLSLIGLVNAPSAQAQWALGPHVGLNLDNDEFLLGGTARIPLASSPIVLNPGIELYPGIDDTGGGLSRSRFVLNLDAQYEFDTESLRPYAGGGISWSRESTDTQDASTDFALNLKGGLLFNWSGSGTPYAEALLNVFGGSEALILKAGFLFAIGG